MMTRKLSESTFSIRLELIPYKVVRIGTSEFSEDKLDC